MTIFWRSFRSRSRFLNVPAFHTKLRQGLLERLAPEIVRACAGVVTDWRLPPAFATQLSITSEGIMLGVEPYGMGANHWRWVSRGVPGHIIRARNKKVLSFRTKYSAKTRVGDIFYKGPGNFEGWSVMAKEVDWPGIEPRNFEEEILRVNGPEWRRICKNIVRSAVRAARGR